MKKFILFALVLSALSFVSCSTIAAQFRIPGERNIRIGMTEQELRESIGYPISKNRTMTDGKTYIQYVYRNNVYVYTLNGIVTSWQD